MKQKHLLNDLELIKIYNDLLSGNIKRFPSIFKDNLQYIIPIAKYLYKDILKLNDISEICDITTEKLLIKYKLNNIVKRYFTSNCEFIKYVYHEEKVFPWMFKLGSRNYYYNDNYIKQAAEFIINKYNITISDVYNGNIKHQWFVESRLDCMLNKRFKSSMTAFFEWYYNNYTSLKFDIHKSKFKHNNYYTEERIINIIKNDLHKLGFNEYKHSKSNIKILNKYFKKGSFAFSDTTIYKLGDNFYDIFKKVFPNYTIHPWEFKITQRGYWQNKKNRISALKQLIDIYDFQLDSIKKYLNYGHLEKKKLSKFNSVCDKYYDCDYYLWFNEVYPNLLKPEEFHSDLIIHKGYKMKSYCEVIIHDYLEKKYNNVKYIENHRFNWFYNSKYDEYYCPDWIINGNIIVEYFGWYLLNNNDNKIKKYVKKANRKVEFYNGLQDYEFIALYPEDFKYLKVI